MISFPHTCRLRSSCMFLTSCMVTLKNESGTSSMWCVCVCVYVRDKEVRDKLYITCRRATSGCSQCVFQTIDHRLSITRLLGREEKWQQLRKTKVHQFKATTSPSFILERPRNGPSSTYVIDPWWWLRFHLGLFIL